MTDTEHREAVRAAVDRLNAAIEAAAADGIECEVVEYDSTAYGDGVKRCIVQVRMNKRIA